MSKYYVSATRKSPTGKITALKVHSTDAEGAFHDSQSTTMTHDEVARSILAGNSYVTIVLTGKVTPKWRTGANVEVVLRTDQNGSTSDNLDNLPDF